MADWTAEQLSIYEDFRDGGDAFPVVVREPGDSGTWNDDTGVYDGATPDTDHPTYGLKQNRNIKDKTGTLIQTTVTVLLIPAYGLPNLDANNEILIDGETQEVERITIVDPGNVPLIFEVLLG